MPRNNFVLHVLIIIIKLDTHIAILFYLVLKYIFLYIVTGNARFHQQMKHYRDQIYYIFLLFYVLLYHIFYIKFLLLLLLRLKLW